MRTLLSVATELSCDVSDSPKNKPQQNNKAAAAMGAAFAAGMQAAPPPPQPEIRHSYQQARQEPQMSADTLREMIDAVEARTDAKIAQAIREVGDLLGVVQLDIAKLPRMGALISTVGVGIGIVLAAGALAVSTFDVGMSTGERAALIESLQPVKSLAQASDGPKPTVDQKLP